MRALWLSLWDFNKHVQQALCLHLVTDSQVRIGPQLQSEQVTPIRAAGAQSRITASLTA
eukprot:m.34364 g.34364  ORF g.34364 m.34364 type:complete len:59 (-) comp43495_c0_seq4:57-233(-)